MRRFLVRFVGVVTVVGATMDFVGATSTTTTGRMPFVVVAQIASNNMRSSPQLL